MAMVVWPSEVPDDHYFIGTMAWVGKCVIGWEISTRAGNSATENDRRKREIAAPPLSSS
jgi:hypothetical protein